MASAARSPDRRKTAHGPPTARSRREVLLAVALCLQGKGCPARVTDEGGIRIEGDFDPSKLRDPARLQPPPPLTADQLRELYRYVVAQTECMRQAGYPVSDPPPFQVWVDSDRAFDPYSDLRARGIDFDHADLLRCQALPERPKFLDE